MIKQCVESERKDRIIDYIGDQYLKVPYFYSNLKRYGTESEHVSVWVDMEREELKGAYLLYYDCLHFFTREQDYPVSNILEMLNAAKPKVIVVMDEIGARLAPNIENSYDIERNYIWDISVMAADHLHPQIEAAHLEDVEEIADLMMKDPEYYTVYDRETLLAQIRSRLLDGYGRTFVIRKDGKIVTTYSVYGETDNMAILGGLLVHPQYRRQGLAQEIIRSTCRMLTDENKHCITFVNFNNIPSLELHKSHGAVILSSTYKFVKQPAVN